MANSQPTTDEEIAISTQKGNKEAFGFLVEKYEIKIKNYIRRFVQEKETINDISQGVFLKAFVNIQSFKPKLKFSAWLYRIAHNELVNFLKKKKALPLFDLDILWPGFSTDKRQIETDVEKQMLLDGFEKCFEQLAPKYREIIVLYYLENLSYQEIAEVLKSPTATVGVRLKRAKEIVRAICQKNPAAVPTIYNEQI